MAPKRNIEQQQRGEEEGKRVRARRTYTSEPAFTRTTRSKTTELVKASAAAEKNEAVPKKTAAAKAKPKAKASAAAAVDDDDDDDGKKEKLNGEAEEITGKTVIVEYCKQCSSFKTRAFQVKEGLEKAVTGTTVILNPYKPRRGCFEIREDGGETFTSLLDMKRPFKPMKELDMEKLISVIADKIRS